MSNTAQSEQAPLLAPLVTSNRNYAGSNEVPTDKYRLAYFIFIIQGLGILLPWNAFISAADYFTRLYDSSFMFFISMVFNWSGALCYIFIKVLPKFSFWSRVMSSLALFFVTLIVIPFLEPVPHMFSKIVTLVAVFITGIAASIMQSSIAGMAALFPPEYIGGMMSGCGVAGIVAIALRIITKAAIPDATSGIDPSVTLFFILAASVAILCAATFVVLWRLPITKHHLYSLEQTKVLEKLDDKTTNFRTVSQKIWKEATVVTITLFITLSLFPGVTNLLKSSSTHFSGDWYSIFITSLFMLFDFIGRTLPQWVRIFSPSSLLVPAVSRLVFFPLFVICIHPHVFHAEWIACIIISMFALTNGYCSTMAMIYGPQQVSTSEKELAGIVLSGCLTSGIVLGSHFALLMLYLINGSIGI